jgi:hypothetical protein
MSKVKIKGSAQEGQIMGKSVRNFSRPTLKISKVFKPLSYRLKMIMIRVWSRSQVQSTGRNSLISNQESIAAQVMKSDP